MKNIVAGGSSTQRAIMEMYIIQSIKYVNRANGKYMSLIRIPNT